MEKFKELSTHCVLLVAALLMGSCASISPSNEIELTQDSVVTVGTNPPEQRKKGELIEIGDQPAFVEAPGHVGLLVLPQKSQKSRALITLKAMGDWTGPAVQKKQNRLVSDVVGGINEVQIYLSSGRNKEALSKVDDLLALYPGITYLKFLKASCLIVNGNTAQARVVLESALKEYPDYKPGLELWESMTGQKSRGLSSEGGKKE